MREQVAIIRVDLATFDAAMILLDSEVVLNLGSREFVFVFDERSVIHTHAPNQLVIVGFDGIDMVCAIARFAYAVDKDGSVVAGDAHLVIGRMVGCARLRLVVVARYDVVSTRDTIECVG